MLNKKIIKASLVIAMTASLLMGCSETSEKEKEEVKTSNVEAESVDTKKVFVTPQWVQSVIDNNQKESEDYVILECSWGETDMSEDYKSGHIKGAYHMNTDYIESEELWNLRTPEEIEKVLKDYGITKDTTVIVYSNDVLNAADERVAWTLLWAGVENVKLLDGGIEAYKEAGYELETTINEPVKTDEDFGVEIPANEDYVISIDETIKKLEEDDFSLVSIRSYDEFIGKVSGYSYMPLAGEPKGAIWGKDTADYLEEDGTVVDYETLTKYVEEAGSSMDNELAFYCGTGWRAALPLLIAYENNNDNVSLYDGGWYQWYQTDGLEVQKDETDSGEWNYLTTGELNEQK